MADNTIADNTMADNNNQERKKKIKHSGYHTFLNHVGVRRFIYLFFISFSFTTWDAY